jgi:hypothetical protein
MLGAHEAIAFEYDKSHGENDSFPQQACHASVQGLCEASQDGTEAHEDCVEDAAHENDSETRRRHAEITMQENSY